MDKLCWSYISPAEQDHVTKQQSKEKPVLCSIIINSKQTVGVKLPVRNEADRLCSPNSELLLFWSVKTASYRKFFLSAWIRCLFLVLSFEPKVF